MQPKFSLIIPTVNGNNLVRQCLKSFYNVESNRKDFEIIVVDDGSNNQTQQTLKIICERYQTKLILKPKNEGFAKTVNAGLSAALGEYIILVNNDIIFTKKFLDKFEESFDKDSDIGIVGAKLLYKNGLIQHGGMVRDPLTNRFIHIGHGKPEDYYEANQSKYLTAVTGALFGINRALYKTIGGLNNSYFLACEDTEYCIRSWYADYRIYYNHEIEAIHLEGETRGKTDNEKKEKSAYWLKKESETIDKFLNDISDYNLDEIDEKVKELNRKENAKIEFGKRKLEIGCGYNPQPGYTHLDVRRLPDVELVCDFSNQKLPCHDNSYDEILSNHSIEHISYRKLPFVLSEWNRVLVPGGRVILRTPDLRFICQMYLAGKITPEYPDDEKFITENLSRSITPAWWANIKLFAGQDYDSNFHFLCFDFEMLKSLLERFGFEKVRRLNLDKAFSPGELQVEAFKKGEPKSTKTKKILIRRRGAMGDVILSTPIIEELRSKYPQDNITFSTDCEQALKNNKSIDKIIPYTPSNSGYEIIYDLDMVYENNPKIHIIDAYSLSVFGHTDINKKTILNYTEKDIESIGLILRQLSITNYIVIHPAVSWKNRTLPKSFWLAVEENAKSIGLNVISVGSGSDYPGMGIDLKEKLTLQQISVLIENSRGFIGSDSGILHVAGTTSAPIAGIFTCAKGENRMPFRNTCSDKIIKPQLDCYGCLHEQQGVTYSGCKINDFSCVIYENKHYLKEVTDFLNQIINY